MGQKLSSQEKQGIKNLKPVSGLFLCWLETVVDWIQEAKSIDQRTRYFPEQCHSCLVVLESKVAGTFEFRFHWSKQLSRVGSHSLHSLQFLFPLYSRKVRKCSVWQWKVIWMVLFACSLKGKLLSRIVTLRVDHCYLFVFTTYPELPQSGISLTSGLN